MVHLTVVELAGIGPVQFYHSKRAKHLNIVLKPFSPVRVAVPRGVSLQRAQEIVWTKEKWLLKHLVKLRQIEATQPTLPVSTPLEVAQSGEKLVTRLKQLAAQHHFTLNKVTIRQQRTRWGSCSPHNNISLNRKLAYLPPALLDYVLLHELLHTKIKNHQPRFWRELEKLVGDVKNLRASLRQYDLRLL